MGSSGLIAAGGTTLATGAIPNGGQQDFSASSGAVSLRRVHVTQNETVYLAIGLGAPAITPATPPGSASPITSEPSWDLAEDYRRTTADANPFADRSADRASGASRAAPVSRTTHRPSVCCRG